MSTEAEVKEALEKHLWNFIDLQAAHPTVKPDERIWGHVGAYAPLFSGERQVDLDVVAQHLEGLGRHTEAEGLRMLNSELQQLRLNRALDATA